MSNLRSLDWPAYPDYASLPAPGSIPNEFHAFNETTLGHYRYTSSERFPVDAERGKFNTRDFPNIQACIDAAVDYSQNSPAAVANGEPVPALIEIDQSLLAESIGTPINVTIPATTKLVFRGKDNRHGGMRLNITYTATSGQMSYLTFDGIRNIGDVYCPDDLYLVVRGGGLQGNLLVDQAASIESYDADNGGVWSVSRLRFARFEGGVFRGGNNPAVHARDPHAGSRLEVKGGYWPNAGISPIFQLDNVDQARVHLSGVTFTLGQLFKQTGSGAADNFFFDNCRQFDEGNGASVLPLIEIATCRSVAIQNCATAVYGWPQAGFADIANVGNLSITGNQILQGNPINGSTAPIRVGTIGARAVISHNIGSPYAHVADLSPAAAANTTMIGNRFSFTTALATNAPAINLGNI